MENRGFLVIATTHPYYGRMAANLANTIKAVSPDMPVAVIGDEAGLRHLNDNERALFSKIITPAEAGGGLAGVNRMRMNLHKLTPFKETVAIDVDMMWLPKADPASVFSLLNDRDFTIVNEGYTDLDTGLNVGNAKYSHWADPSEIKEAYGLTGKLFKSRGEFVVFRKGDTVNKLYKLAKEIQRSPKVAVDRLGGSVTDEFALNIAMNQVGIEPHKVGWQPTYWPVVNGNRIPAIFKLDGYYAISFGGNALPREAPRVYDILGKGAAAKTGVRYRFPVHPKNKFLQERRHS